MPASSVGSDPKIALPQQASGGLYIRQRSVGEDYRAWMRHKKTLRRRRVMMARRSLRRHYPEQVLRVEGCAPSSQPVYGLPVDLHGFY
jgi:hypothetical protein